MCYFPWLRSWTEGGGFCSKATVISVYLYIIGKLQHIIKYWYYYLKIKRDVTKHLGHCQFWKLSKMYLLVFNSAASKQTLNAMSDEKETAREYMSISCLLRLGKYLVRLHNTSYLKLWTFCFLWPKKSDYYSFFVSRRATRIACLLLKALDM